jgi:hypothetical protein
MSLPLAVAPLAAQTKEKQISFDLVPSAAFIECMRGPSGADPRAHVTVTRGKLNDSLLLVLDGFKPGLAFDLFTVQNSNLRSDGSPDPAFKGFGLAWYQSDVQVSRRQETGRVRIRTILLDQIFGFDPAVGLAPTNTFHVGFWFNDPQDAVACGFDPAKPTPFNGEHKAGPLAMISVPDPITKLGPLCTDPRSTTTPISCNP